MKRTMRFKNWYPNNAEEIENYIPDVQKKKHAIGIVSPHAGWIYSGMTAGTTYASSQICDTYVILCPSHTGLGPEISIYPAGSWETPIGDLEIDYEFAKLIALNSKFAEFDDTAHIMEHSLEVQLPFIKKINPSAKIVSICMKTYEYKKCMDLAEAIYKASNEYLSKKICVVASTDMSHYSNAAIAKICDDLAIKEIMQLDGKGLLEVVEERNISMCGASPVAAMLFYSKLAGAKKAELLRYSNSGEVSGDFSEVVGYAGMIIY
ncbi:MAG: AmmeMemoRadiSam system protein B [Endomicrobia bacterium]|nr:AmmeMemoRadiSam system protein B [Endomicrobiia bacterium]